MVSAPEDFSIGDRVRKFVTEQSVSPYIGIVTQLCPSTYKVWVQWPDGNASQEDPDALIRVNPIFGLPAVHRDKGYNSYEKSLSEKFYGKIPKAVLSTDKMAIRIAHTFATKVIGRLVDEIVDCHEEGMNDIQTYDRMYRKYSSICSDHILRESVERVYQNLKESENVSA